MSDSILRLKDAPNYFKVSRTTIWRWRKQGIIKPYLIGRIAYVRISDILHQIDNGQSRNP